MGSSFSTEEEYQMVKWALVCLVAALVAGVFGLTGLAGAAAKLALILFGLALAGFVILLALGFTLYKKVT